MPKVEKNSVKECFHERGDGAEEEEIQSVSTQWRL